MTRVTPVEDNEYMPARGFTLVELMVVISIIAIIATVGLIMYTQAEASARDSVRREDIINIATAIEAHHNLTNNSYNFTNSDLSDEFPETPNAQNGKDPMGNYYIMYTTTTIGSIALPTSCTSSGYVPLPTPVASGGELNSGTAKAWMLCSCNLEASSPNIFCKGSTTSQ